MVLPSPWYCPVVLSRSIPFNLDSPPVISAADEHRVWQALEAARTQHRRKTVAYVYGIGKLCREEKGWGEDWDELSTLRDVDRVIARIKERVKEVEARERRCFRDSYLKKL
jgi:hypothetical protein